MFNMAHMGAEILFLCENQDGLRESSESKPANEIYREESEVYYQPFKTMFQATIGGQKRLLFFFCSGQKRVRSCQKKKESWHVFSVRKNVTSF